MAAGSGKDYEPATILAIDLDKAGRRLARRLGLRMGRKVRLKNLHLEVTRFRSGPKKDVRRVLQALLRGKSKAVFDLNHYYKLAGNTAECKGIRCYLSRIIDKLRRSLHGFRKGKYMPAFLRNYFHDQNDNTKKCNDIRCYPQNLINWPDNGQTGQGVTIGMVDTTVNHNMPCLADRHIHIKSFVRNHRPAKTGHGTAVASLLVGKSDSRFPGLIPDANLYAAATFFTDKAGHTRASALAIARALDWLVARNVSVINMSLSGPRNRLLVKAVARVLQQDKIVVAAAGNNGPKASPAYPAAIKGVVAITAVDRFKRHYPRSNQGRYITFAAPGVTIWTPAPDGRGRFRSGTSFAAAYFSAMAAVQLNRPEIRQGPKIMLETFRESALDLGPPGKDTMYGWGLARCPQTH